jgi:murein L,D-transpeptidase YcbB/YkuD
MLWLYDHHRVTDAMRVVVGKVSEPTPNLIGVIRRADLNPYWETPPDLARESVAPRVLAEGTGYLAAHHLQVLSGWETDATPIAPDTVDWPAVARGADDVRLRQAPGPDNMMGAVKYVLPNPLGVYLHDTPNKALFANATRAESAGCIRLADAAELGRRLFGRSLVADPSGGADQHVELAPAVPVYVIYLTALPTPAGPVFYQDIYSRDRVAGPGLGSSSQAARAPRPQAGTQ